MDLLTDVERHMRAFDDQELQRIVAFNRGGYGPEAISVAQAELRRRSLAVLTADEYEQRFPQERITTTGFCVACMQETTDESPGNTHLHISLGAFGTSLSGEDDACAACGSVVQVKRLWVVVPLARQGSYRVIYPNQGAWGHPRSGRLIGRRLRSDMSR